MLRKMLLKMVTTNQLLMRTKTKHLTIKTMIQPQKIRPKMKLQLMKIPQTQKTKMHKKPKIKTLKIPVTKQMRRVLKIKMSLILRREELRTKRRLRTRKILHNVKKTVLNY